MKYTLHTEVQKVSIDCRHPQNTKGYRKDDELNNHSFVTFLLQNGAFTSLDHAIMKR